MTKYFIAFTCSLICILLTPLPARASTLPGGTVLWVRTLEPVSSSDKAGKKFAAQLDTSLIVKGKVTAPAGSKVYGRVESSRSAGQSKLELSLTQIVVNGRPVAIATEIYEESGPRSGRTTASRATAGKAIGATVGGTAASYAIGVLGTAIGAALGVPAAGAAIGTLGAAFGAPAAGAAIGNTTGLIGQRKSVVAPPGTPFEFRLARPVSL
jgi:hypothetical protein